MLTIQEDSLNWALNHSIKYGDTDVFPIPFEYEAIRHDWDNIKGFLIDQDLLNWKIRPLRVLLSPKAKYGFRFVTQLDPLDFIVFASVVKEIANDVEARRVPVDQNRVFSYRVNIDNTGQLFGREIGYRNFLSQCTAILNSNLGYSHVATTDIADFYCRIYSHRLENALNSATTKTNHVKTIKNLLSGWNGTESFGIPVGNAPSRLLAEITLADIDEALLANGIEYVRYNDDYRIFAKSYTEAYRHIAFLADVLYRNHGLALQPQKTDIFTEEKFRQRFLITPAEREINSLHERFENLIGELGINDWYEEIDYDALEPEQQEVIDALNLVELFQEEVRKNEEPDLPLLKFILRRLSQLGDDSLVEDIFANIENILPIIPDVVGYLNNLRYLNEEQKRNIGERVLTLLDNSILSELAFHRMWILDLFTHSREWDNENRFFGMYASEADSSIKRKLILAMGRSSQRHYFQSQWRSLFDHPHWPRRALIAGASCMPADARRHWFRSIEPRLDLLELAVMRWVRQNPFN